MKQAPDQSPSPDERAVAQTEDESAGRARRGREVALQVEPIVLVLQCHLGSLGAQACRQAQPNPGAGRILTDTGPQAPRDHPREKVAESRLGRAKLGGSRRFHLVSEPRSSQLRQRLPTQSPA